ncbi:hypothetical protein BGX34_009990 [Mortierella sp. NVP85]|nr:hypothetical protein BGX34_009990 [Mortierella sp. NVP85]
MTGYEQSFWTKSSTEIITIPTRVDNKTGNRIILWKDVQQYFKNAQGVLNDGKAVLFLTDDNFEYLIPLRIPYHPNGVLEVVVEDTVINSIGNFEYGPNATIGHISQGTMAADWIHTANRCYGSFNEGTALQASLTSFYSPFSPYSVGATADIDSVSQQAASLFISSAQSNERTLAVYQGTTDTEAFPLTYAPHQTYNLNTGAMQPSQESITSSIKGAMNEHFQKLQAEMGKNRELQEQILSIQQQTLDRLAVIQNRLQAVLTQTYQLHEYPIPRLFIVLPKQTRSQHKLLKPFSDQFRLYFLCECGAHTMPEGSTTQHEIHMAKHEGYDLDKPNEFFEKYGSYVLALMYMVKYGIMAAGIVVPPLASSKVMDGLDTAEKHMDYLKKNIGPLVDDSIAFLQDHKSAVADDVSKNGDSLQLEKMEVLEGADLRQLESYLKAKDKHRVLGNLYRIVTHEGYVKWVCIDHYRANYRESASQGLREIVDLHKGSFMEDLGSIQIELGSYTRAKQFYNALMNSRGVHKLDITLAWDLTMSELQKLADTVAAANIVDLTIDGTFFQGPARDVINRNRRYDPIMQIASNGRLQSLTLIGLKNMPQRIGLDSFARVSNLRSLKLYETIFTNVEGEMSFLGRILTSTPSLVHLRLSHPNATYRAKAVAALLSDRHGLETLDINNEILLTRAVVTQGRITAFKVKIRPKVDVLGVFYDLVEVLRANPFLSEITIEFHAKFVPVVIDLISARLESKKTALRRVVLKSSSGEPAIVAEFEDGGGIPDVSVSVNIGYKVSTEPFLLLLESYGWSVKALDVRFNEIDDRFAQAFDKGTEEKGSKLRTLKFDSTELSHRGWKNLGSVMERSLSLDHLDIKLGREGGRIVHWRLEKLLTLKSAALRGLELGICTPEDVRPWFEVAFPTRLAFPNLVSLKIVPARLVTIEASPSHVQWISAMTAAATKQASLLTSSSLPGMTLNESSDFTTNTLKTWSPLKRLILRNVDLQPRDWAVVIEDLDFSALQELDLSHTNFSLKELDLLVKSIGKVDFTLPLRFLGLTCTQLRTHEDMLILQAASDVLKEKAPDAMVEF